MYDQTGKDGRIVYGWKTRFADFAPGALEQFQGNFFDNQKTTAKAFYSLSTERLKTLAKKYGASYLVVEKPNQRDLPICYGVIEHYNPEFTIYALTPEAAAAPYCKP